MLGGQNLAIFSPKTENDPPSQMLEVVITTSQNSCSTDFENESEKKKQIAVNAFKTRVKSPGPNPAFKNSDNQITLSSAVFNSR